MSKISDPKKRAKGSALKKNRKKLGISRLHCAGLKQRSEAEVSQTDPFNLAHPPHHPVWVRLSSRGSPTVDSSPLCRRTEKERRLHSSSSLLSSHHSLTQFFEDFTERNKIACVNDCASTLDGRSIAAWLPRSRRQPTHCRASRIFSTSTPTSRLFAKSLNRTSAFPSRRRSEFSTGRKSECVLFLVHILSHKEIKCESGKRVGLVVNTLQGKDPVHRAHVVCI